MNHLLRELAPLPGAAWDAIEEEARRALRAHLAARKLVELRGPLGWEHHAVATGRVRPISGFEGVGAQLRLVQPLLELRAEMTLARAELEAVGRGATDPDLEPVAAAARRLALAEDRLVFDGLEEACGRGLVSGSPHEPLTIGDDYAGYPALVAEATETLRLAGVAGPYAVALGPRCYTGLRTAASGGYPVVRHVEQLLDGPLVWAPGLAGAVVLSLRGGDFELVLGQDVSVGYLDHDAERVRLYLEESVTFRLLGPEAVVALRYAR